MSLLPSKLGTKIIGLICTTLVGSIAAVAWIATELFTLDNSAMIRQMNADTASSVSQQVVQLIESFQSKSSLLAQMMLTEKQGSSSVVTQALESDPEFLGLLVLGRDATKKTVLLKQVLSLSLKETETRIKKSVFSELINQKDFQSQSVFDLGVSQLSVLNSDPTVVAFTFPLIKISNSFTHAVIAIYSKKKLTKILSNFETVTPYIINSKGVLIAHASEKRSASSEDLSNLSIVKTFMEGKLPNFETRYLDSSHREWKLGAYQSVGFGGLAVVAEVPEERAFASSKRVQYRSLLVAVAVLALSIMVGYFFSGTLSRPIQTLISAAKSISEGDFKINIKAKGRDEISYLSRSFNKMAKGLEERDQVKNAFAKFHSKELAEKMLSGELKLGGERREAVVFFSDIRGFTKMSENVDPELIVKILNRYMSTMVKIILSHGGVIDKYVGDAIMAVWGVPISRGGEHKNAVNACLEMRRALIQLNQDFQSEGLPQIKIGMGLNSGPVIAGNIGSDDRMEYTVIGDTVNTASRIESLTKELGTDLLVSESLYQSLKSDFEFVKSNAVQVKGKSELLTVYQVQGPLGFQKTA